MRTKTPLILILSLLLLGSNLKAAERFQGVLLQTPLYLLGAQRDFENDQYKVENSKSSQSGYAALLLFKSGFGVGLTRNQFTVSQDTTFKVYNYFSGTTETSKFEWLDFSYTWGDRANFTLGGSLLRSAELEIVYDNPVCTQYNRVANQVDGNSFFAIMGLPLGQKGALLLSFRNSTITASYPGLDSDYPRTFTSLSGGYFWGF